MTGGAGWRAGVARLRVAEGFASRLRGLMWKRDLPRGEALLIPRCAAVHTCFMRFPLDLVFLDAEDRPVRTVRGVRPWRLCVRGGPGARSVVEARAGWIAAEPGGFPPVVLESETRPRRGFPAAGRDSSLPPDQMPETSSTRAPGPRLPEIAAAAAKAAAGLSALDGAFEEAAAAVIGALRSGGKVLSAGNGGSAAEAMHLAEELSGRYHAERRALPGLALSADGTALTCIGNDYGFENVFSRQVEAFCAPGDVLALFTTSGRSGNLLRAAEAAKARGARVLGFTGGGGGPLAPLCDVLLDVPDAAAAHVQECHQVLLHALLERVDAAFAGN